MRHDVNKAIFIDIVETPSKVLDDDLESDWGNKTAEDMAEGLHKTGRFCSQIEWIEELSYSQVTTLVSRDKTHLKKINH